MIGCRFDQSDGLSRLHAIVVAIHGRIMIFDLASRYGLRDMRSASRLMRSAFLDNNIGCMIYGAGQLVYR